jgi:ribonucleoside-diphosphate reductase alpha chain
MCPLVEVTASTFFPKAADHEVVLIPKLWSFEASRLLVTKYFRKAGVPVETVRVNEDLPIDLRRSVPFAGTSFGRETSAHQVFTRMAGCWAWWGMKLGYFDTPEDAVRFFEYMRVAISYQEGAPNSPQWFNTGLHWAYGIDGKATGHWYCDEKTGEPILSDSAYQRPQPSACFILGVKDDLVRDGGIMDLVRREASLFKFGSGAGSNFSKLRAAGEPLSGGGVSSGLMGWLKILDRSAAAIQSGGTTRRAAKMVVLDDDHPEFPEFIRWKTREEWKVADLVCGSKVMDRHLGKIYQLSRSGLLTADVVAAATDDGVPKSAIQHVFGLVRQGKPWSGIEAMNLDWQGEAYLTVAGQQSNNSARLSDAFMQAAETAGPWDLKARLSGEVVDTLSASKLLDDIAMSTWTCGDPGIQFKDTIQRWNPVSCDGEIRSSNPCGEFYNLDDTACNLASLNLMKFFDAARGFFDIARFEDAVRAWMIASDISVSMAQYPSREIALGSWKYRSTGLGYGNLATLLTWMGLPYDDPRARKVAAWITMTLTRCAWIASAEISRTLGPFPRYMVNQDAMGHVLAMHSDHTLAVSSWFMDHEPVLFRKIFGYPADHDASWASVRNMVEMYGMRNSHITCIAPTGTIGLVMDCDTTGLEPDYALVKFKEYAGGGSHLFVSQALPRVLAFQGYTPTQVLGIVSYIQGTRTIPDGLDHLLSEEERLEARLALPCAMSLDQVFSDVVMAKIIQALPDYGKTPGVLARYMLGTGTIEGAPHLSAEHAAVFKTTRQIAWRDHMAMLAEIQPFVSGGISKTINMPASSTIDDVREAIFSAWRLGIKGFTIYRDGSKFSQPLSSFDLDIVEELPQDFAVRASETVERGPSEKLEKVVRTDEKMDPKVVVRYLSRRRRLPDLRRGYTQKAVIDNNKIFLHTGEYEDGTLGEIFIDMHKQGATLSGLMAAFATAVSLGLQHGVPLEKYVDLFSYQTFEPNGMVQGDSRISMCQSIIDYIFRHLAVRYLGRQDMAHFSEHTVRLSPPDEPWEDEETAERALDQVGASRIAPPPMKETKIKVEKVAQGPTSIPLGFVTGAICRNPSCRKATMVQNGNCMKCTSCGETTGCS